MSVNRDMKPYTLQKGKKTRTESGQERTSWEDKTTILVAVYKNNDMITTASARYNSSSHTGLTHCKQLKEGLYRLVSGKTIYQITDCNTKPRLTNLILKEVDCNV